MKKKNDLIIFMCPPFPEYQEQPADQSHCELRECPKCKGQMWLSDKKKGMLLFSSCLGKEIFLACYDCIKKTAKENPEVFRGHTRVDI